MLIVPANECPPNQDRNPFVGCELSAPVGVPLRTNLGIDVGLPRRTGFSPSVMTG